MKWIGLSRRLKPGALVFVFLLLSVFLVASYGPCSATPSTEETLVQVLNSQGDVVNGLTSVDAWLSILCTGNTSLADVKSVLQQIVGYTYYTSLSTDDTYHQLTYTNDKLDGIHTDVDAYLYRLPQIKDALDTLHTDLDGANGVGAKISGVRSDIGETNIALNLELYNTGEIAGNTWYSKEKLTDLNSNLLWLDQNIRHATGEEGQAHIDANQIEINTAETRNAVEAGAESINSQLYANQQQAHNDSNLQVGRLANLDDGLNKDSQGNRIGLLSFVKDFATDVGKLPQMGFLLSVAGVQDIIIQVQDGLYNIVDWLGGHAYTFELTQSLQSNDLLKYVNVIFPLSHLVLLSSFLTTWALWYFTAAWLMRLLRWIGN